MNTPPVLPRPEFDLGAMVILKDSGRSKETLLSGVIVEISYSLPRRSVSPARIQYAVELDLGLTMRCNSEDLYLDRRPKP